jgi:hypothetical protein
MIFARESMGSVWHEIQPLLREHWEEVAFYPDIPLAPDEERYRQMDAAGILRVYTVRREGVLHGYAVFFVLPSLHYSTQRQATCDVVYLVPEVRGGAGYRFIAWCDEQLRGEGVDLVSHHVKVKLDWSPLLERLGYEWMDKILVRRFPKKGYSMSIDPLVITGGV